MIVWRDVIKFFRDKGDHKRADLLESAYFEWTDARSKTDGQSAERRLLDGESLREEVARLRRDVNEIKEKTDRVHLGSAPECVSLTGLCLTLERMQKEQRAARAAIATVQVCPDCGARISAEGTCACDGREWGRIDPMWQLVDGCPLGLMSEPRFSRKPVEHDKPEEVSEQGWIGALGVAIDQFLLRADHPYPGDTWADISASVARDLSAVRDFLRSNSIGTEPACVRE